jgi:hypothetical protein
MTSDKLSPVGRIERKEYYTDDLREAFPAWDELSDSEKLDCIRQVDEDSVEEVFNVTTSRFHEYLVDNLNPEDDSTGSNIDAEFMALGVDSASGTDVQDTDLNDRVFEKSVTDHVDNGNELLASTFISSTEANNNTLNEIGLFTGNPNNLGNSNVFLINHATFSDVVKDNERTITFDVTLSFSDN